MTTRGSGVHPPVGLLERADHAGLQEAVVQFPEAWPLTYNLACFCAALGKIEEAREWLKRALDANGAELKLQALNDPDLAPVWSAPV